MSERLPSSAIPQADRVERVLEYAVLLHHQHHALRELLYRGRDALYYRSGARILGLVDADGEPSMRTTDFAEHGEEPLELLRECFVRSAVGQAWARWAKTSLWSVDPDTAEAFLEDMAELAPATAQRRAKTLRTWLEELAPELSGPSAVSGFDTSNFATILELWEARLSHLDARDSQIVLRRSGALREVETLEALGETFELTRERVRQLEKRGLERLRGDDRWMQPILAGLERQRGESSYLFVGELESDPFLRPLTDRPEFATYLARRVLGDEWHAYAWDEGELLLTRPRAREPEAAWTKLAKTVRKHSWPAPYATFLELVSAVLAEDEADLRPLLIERAHANLLLDDDQHPSEVLQFGQSRANRILAHVATLDGPVSVNELKRLFGRGALPDALIMVRRGQVALPRHFPDFERWERRLAPLVRERIEQEGPERQWMAHDLLELVSEDSRLPEWITPWLLTSMLRRSPLLTYLGRQRFALPDSGPQTRVQLVPAAVEILEQAGGPLSDQELRARLSERVQLLDQSFMILRTTIPLFPTGAGTVGLVERDLPGGLAALQSAGEQLETVLRGRGRGLTFHQARAELATLGPPYDHWSEAIVPVVARARPTLTANRVGVGLDAWDEVRVPSNAEILRELLDEGEGVARFDDFVARILATRGREPTRATVAGVANFVGARMRGDHVVVAELAADFEAPAETREPEPEPKPSAAARSGPTPPALALGSPEAAPLPAHFPGARDLRLPRVARALYAKLAQESPGDWEAVLRRGKAHAARFEDATAQDEFLPVREARELIARLPQLVERACSSEDLLAHRLAWIAARYFEIADDGELDFSIGGLDDDVAVFNAIARHLGHEDLAFEPT